MYLTIFTPAYNRAGTLIRLYDSLLQQTNRNFEWLIVDDGSVDNTRKLVDKWIEEEYIPIRYYYQKNAGKMAAHNKGVELANGELFLCVDSDDLLTCNCVDRIINTWSDISGKAIGILAYKKQLNGESTTTIKDKRLKFSTLKDAYDYHGLSGDTMLVFDSKIIKKYRFPSFQGEKFIPEGYLYDLLDQEGKLFFLHEPLYICEYQQDGYTKNIASLLKNNPCGYMAFINQRLRRDIRFKHRFLDTIRYIAMAIATGEKNIIRSSVYPRYAVLAYPMGVLFYLKRYKKI